jgi:hypothetical protein
MSKAPPGLWSIALFALASGVLAAEANPAHYIDLTRHFARFHDETAGVEEAARVARFRKQMDALLPGFYTPRFGATDAQYNGIFPRPSTPASSISARSSPASARRFPSTCCIRSGKWTAARANWAARST